jgi:HK97 family phage prohead protease
MLKRIKKALFIGLGAKFALAAALLALLGGLKAYDEIQVTYFPKTYEISGVCSTSVEVRGVVIATSAFMKDHIALATGNKPIPLMINHSNNIQHIVGKITALDLRFGKTLFQAKIIANKANRAVIQKLLDGTLTDVSIGFKPVKYDIAPDGKSAMITELDLFEISLVFAGADPGAHITSIKELE